MSKLATMTYWFYTATVQVEENEFAFSNVIESENKFFPIAKVHEMIIREGEVAGEAIGFNVITEMSEDDFKYFKAFIESGMQEFEQVYL